MQIKTHNATSADITSAQVLFQTLFQLRDLYFPHIPADARLNIFDPFARNGQLTVANYENLTPCAVTAWELSDEHKAMLRSYRNVELARTGQCSYQTLAGDWRKQVHGFPDMVVIDTPQGVHKDGWGDKRYEHFSFLTAMLERVKGTPMVFVLYVNLDPYDAGVAGEHGYDRYAEYDYKKWVQARRTFYKTSSHAQCVTMAQVLAAYERQAAWASSRLSLPLVVPCYSDVPGKAPYAIRLAFRVTPL